MPKKMTDDAQKARYQQRIVFASIFFGYSLYVLCRKSFSFVIPHVQSEEQLSKEDLGKIVSSLNLAYAISKFCFGILSDNVSATVLFCAGLITTASSVLGFSQFHGVGVFSLFWFLNGFGQGCGWPACSKLLRKWFQKDQFGTWWSVLSASINVTGVVVPLILPFLSLESGGWRSFMFVSGIIAIGWACLSFCMVNDSPESMGLPAFNSEAPKAKKDDGDAKAAPQNGVGDLLNSPFLWLLSGYYLVVFAAKTCFENWAQLLIVDEKDLSPAVASAFLSSFETGGMIGSFTTGYLTDIFVSKMPNSKSSPRMIMVIIYMSLSIGALQLLVTSNVLLPLVGLVLGCSLYGNINIFGIVATESAPIHLSGTSHSIVSLAANVGAVLAGYPFSLIAKSHGWIGVFGLLEISCLVCLVLLLVTRNVSSKIGGGKEEKRD